MSKPAHPTAAPPSFWRWFWHEPGPRPTGRQLAFTLLLTTGVIILMAPGWYRILITTFPLIDVESGAAVLAAILVTLVGAPFAGMTAYTCRPSGWRTYLWASFSSVAAALVAQASVVVSAALTPDWSLDPVTIGMVNVALGFVVLLPGLGVVTAASYFLYWPRLLAQRTAVPPPAA